MNRTTLLLVTALATAVLLVPTGAAPFDLTGTDNVSDDIVLQPANGPNGDYAVLNEEGELELLLTDANPAVDGEGISSNAVVPIPRVFTITYTGDRSATVWVTDDTADVRFFRGSDSDDSMENRANSVVLGPSRTVTVGVRVDTRGEHEVEQAETFTMNAEVAEGDDDTDGYVPPTSTPTPTEGIETVRTPAGTPPTPDREDVETSSSTPSEPPGQPSAESPTESTDSPTTATDGSEDGGLVEPGGLGLGTLLGAVLAVLLLALIGSRQFA